MPPPFDQERVGAEWREVAQRYERVTARMLAHERHRGSGHTIVLAGYGARLWVDHDALILQDGRTHSTHEPARDVLYRAVHDVERIIWIDAAGL
jgi:hypothetical protein